MPFRNTATRALLVVLFALLNSCASIVPEPRESVTAHIHTPEPATLPSSNIPKPVTRPLAPPPPKPVAAAETYTVVVNGVPVRELLFALARDGAINIDIHPGITGDVTLNAIDQTLPQILQRLSGQVDLRYTYENNLLVIEPDSPFLRTYVLDYLTLSRSTTNTVSVSTQLSTGGDGGGSSGNTSTTEIESKSDHDIWVRVVDTIGAMIDDGSKAAAAAAAAAAPAKGEATQKGGPTAEQLAGVETPTPIEAQAPAAAATTIDVIANAEAGLLTVRATERQHAQIQEYLATVESSLRRQVLIEATVVEVNLRDRYQAGIDWSRLPLNAGFRVAQSVLAGGIGTAPFFLLEYANKRDANGNSTGDLSLAARMLKEFGDVRVISSPKVMTLNNQTAVLKVVRNRVYFKIEVSNSTDANGVLTRDVETTPQTAPEGFVMSVTPQIDASDMVTLSVRPTITQVLQFVQDPNPDLGTVVNNVPEFQVREFESIMRAQSGQIAVLGGLMEDRQAKDTDGIPLLSDVKEIGEWFTSRDHEFTKTELVVFIRPWVVRNPSVLNGDLRSYRRYLPENLQVKKPINSPPKDLFK
jgi:MSHA type pilus biogenesis protein MshL